MKAILCTQFGPPEALSIADIPEPAPGPGEVKVRVRAAALNFFDTLIIQGKYQFKPDFPFSPGGEFAGEVMACGEGVSGFTRGQRVAGSSGWGACREIICVKAQSLVPVPDNLPDAQAAGLFITYGTSLHGLRQRGELKAGETLCVLGAAGGTGLSAIEIGVLMGARVIACASSDEKLALCKAHGAHEVINYETENLSAALKKITGGRGVDVMYDPVGGDFAEPALRAMGWKGRYLVIGFAAGEIPKIPLNLTLLKGCDIRGVFWGAFVDKEPQAHADNLRQLVQWAADGKLRVHVGGIYPPEKIAEALGVLARREAAGKLVIRF